MLLYAIVNGQQVGPFTPEDLVNGFPVDASTMVWYEGIPQWVPALSVPELISVINARYAPRPQVVQIPPVPQTATPVQSQPVQSVVNPVYPQQPQTVEQVTEALIKDEGAPYNWLYLAIVAAVIGTFFYLIGAGAGIAALVLAIQAQNKYKAGDIQGAYSLNNTAKILTFVGLGISAFVVLCMMIVTFKFSNPVTMAFSSPYYW